MEAEAFDCVPNQQIDSGKHFQDRRPVVQGRWGFLDAAVERGEKEVQVGQVGLGELAGCDPGEGTSE